MQGRGSSSSARIEPAHDDAHRAEVVFARIAKHHCCCGRPPDRATRCGVRRPAHNRDKGVRGTQQTGCAAGTRRTRWRQAAESFCHALGSPRCRTAEYGRRWSGPYKPQGRMIVKYQRGRFAARASERQEKRLATTTHSPREAAKARNRLYRRPTRPANKIPPIRQITADFGSGTVALEPIPEPLPLVWPKLFTQRV